MGGEESEWRVNIAYETIRPRSQRGPNLRTARYKQTGEGRREGGIEGGRTYR